MCDARIHEMFDLICGTSTGGIIALGTCVVKRPVEEMIQVYRENAGEYDNLYTDLVSCIFSVFKLVCDSLRSSNFPSMLVRNNCRHGGQRGEDHRLSL